ncbi:MAG: GumC family protein [Cypionkella sp.]
MKIDLGYYLAVLLRRLHYIVILFAAGTALAVVVAYKLPPVYESTARLLLESAQIPDALAAPTVDTAALEQLQIVEQRLMTRQNLLEIARKFNAVAKMDTLSPDDIVTAMRKATNIDKQAGRDQASMMTISFDASSAQTAAAVVNEYVTRILSDTTAARTGQAQDTLQFFRQEVERLSADLSTQSAKILDFQNKNADALPATLTYRLTQQTNLQEHLATNERDTAALKDQKKRLIEIYRSTGQLDASRGNAPSPEAQQMAQLTMALNQALAVYAPENPKVVLLQTQIAGLQARIDAQSKDAGQTAAADATGKSGTDQTGAGQAGTDQAGTGDNGTTMAMSPLDIQTTQIDSQMDQLVLQHDAMASQLAALTDSINRSAGVAVQLQALQRDYDNIQGQYNTATDRLSKASTGERIEVLAKGQRIGVLDAASAPDAPARPNRFKIVVLGAMAGFLAGLGLIVLTEMLNSSVRRPIDLEHHLNITPIGTIPYVRTPGETLRRRIVIALVLVVMVVGLPTAVYLLDRYYMPLDAILAKINSKLGL